MGDVGNLGRSGLYLYYNWATGEVGLVKSMRAVFPAVGAVNQMIKGESVEVEFAAMKPVWLECEKNWTRNEIVQLVNESLGCGGGDVEEIIVPEPPGPNVEHEDEDEWYDEDGDDDGLRYELCQTLEGAYARFDIITQIPSRIDKFIRRYVHARNTVNRLDRESSTLQNLGREVAAERDALRN